MSEGHAEHIANPLAETAFPPALLKLRSVSVLVGLAGLAICLLAYFVDPAHFFRSWLFAYLFWISLCTGSMVMVMISHCALGGWGVSIRRFGEASFMNLPLMALFFLPFILGYKYLFPWAHIQDYANDPDFMAKLVHRQPWFTPLWFTVRNLIYFAVWFSFAFALRAGSLKLEQNNDPVLRRRLRKVSAGGIVCFFIIVTSFAMDYVLSREIHFVSSIIGFIMAIGQALAGLSFMTLCVCYFGDRAPLNRIVKPQVLNDLGNLLLALVILWMYTAFAQLLVIWTGNTREDIGYFTHRGLGMAPNPWRWVALFLFLCHFLTPFFLLLMKGLKRKTNTLAGIVCLLLFMRVVDNLWLTAPSGSGRTNDSGHLFWTDPIVFCAMGGIWIFFFLWNLGGKPMVALNTSLDRSELESEVHGIRAHTSAHAG